MDGLTGAEAAERLARYGPNELKEKKGEGIIIRFLRHFTDFLILLLFAAAIVAAAMGEMVDAVMIFAIVLMQAILGFVQEYRAEKSFEALKKMVKRTAMALRDGKVVVVDVRELVPGDVVLLEAGDHVPADGKITESFSLAADEAALTGESVPVQKAPRDEAFMGTVIVAGKGKMLVAGTGMETKMGHITAMVQEAEKEQTPIEKDLEKMGKDIGLGVLALCAVVFLAGLARGFEPLGMFLTSVSLAVAAIPEGLPAIVVITLAVGVQRMSRRNAIVKKLKSVETLGCADVICTDKTGTLTKNEMSVRSVLAGKAITVTGTGYEPKGGISATTPELEALMKAGVLCNSAYLREEDDGWRVIGDPTEGALLVLGAKGGLWKEALEKDNPAIVEFPFESERKMMTVVRRCAGRNTAYVKGAPEMVLRTCTRILDGGKTRKMTPEDIERIKKENDALTSRGQRTLALATRDMDDIMKFTQAGTEKDLTFVGIAGMIDAPREEVFGALSLCKSAGIRVIMITGDHPLTARAIAAELGICNGEVVSGEELDGMKDAELMKRIDAISVYARVSPAHKLRIVNALNSKGHVVAMTGDGVNDAPALKKSDIGVAMGITGTEVAKETSDMVLADDNFATIVAAVEEGRGIYDNIKKSLTYLLSGNIAEVGVIFFAVMLGLPLPLIAIQILWINLVTDGLPAIALAIDPISKDVMKRKPRQKGESIWKGTRPFVFESPAIVTLAALGAFAYIAQYDLLMAQSTVFTMVVMFEKAQVFCSRSLERPVTGDLLGNRWLVYITMLSLGLHLAILYVPALAALFHVKPLGLFEWGISIGLALLVFAYLEIRKWMLRQPDTHGSAPRHAS